MGKARRIAATLVAGGMLATGVLVGSAASAALISSDAASHGTSDAAQPSMVVDDSGTDLTFPHNVDGQTYGSAFGASWRTIPDLVLVITNEGGEGYVPREVLFTEPAHRLKDALDWVPFTGTIDATAADGKTVVGTYTVDRGSSSQE